MKRMLYTVELTDMVDDTVILRKRNCVLESENEKLLKENMDLRDQVNSHIHLIEQYNALFAENANANSEMGTMKKILEKKEKESAELKEEKKNLQKEVQQLKTELKKYKQEYKKAVKTIVHYAKSMEAGETMKNEDKVMKYYEKVWERLNSSDEGKMQWCRSDGVM